MPFDCTDIKATLSGLIDDQIDAETRHLAERHLSECAACRALIGQAEALDELIAIDAATLAPSRLPEGFMEGVLGRTVYARMHEHAGRRWMNWAGALAAAACLGLAATIGFLYGRTVPNAVITARVADAGSGNHRPAAQPREAVGQRSWVFEGALDPGAMDSGAISASFERSVPIDRALHLDDATSKAIDEELALVQPSPSEVGTMLRQASGLAPADSDTLHAAAVLLDLLADSDLESFADIERVRAIAEYDELPQRLAELRHRVRGSDRAVVLAAEGLIVRIINGPMDLDDAKLLRDTAASMNLAAQIGAIGAGRDTATSL